MAGNGPVLNADNRGPLLNIISWILMVVMCLAVLAKGLNKWAAFNSLDRDDGYMLGSMVLVVAMTICTSLQVASGLGQHMSRLDIDRVIEYQKIEYAWQILYPWSLFFARAALIYMLGTLCRTHRRQCMVYAVAALNLTVTVVFTFVIAFQCPIPNTWEVLSGRCFDQTAMWISFGVLDTIIDLTTVMLPIYLLHDLRMRRRSKFPAIMAFTSRALIIPFIVARLVFVNRNHASLDQSFDQWITILLTDVHANVNIIFTCVPFLKPVLLSMQSGILASDLQTMAPNSAARYNRIGLPPKSESKVGGVKASGAVDGASDTG